MISAAQLTVGVEKTKDGNHTMGISFVGDEGQLIPLLGALTHASQWVSKRISQRIGEGAWGNVDGVQKVPITEEVAPVEAKDSSAYPSEQKVPRDKAIEATLYAIKGLQMRVRIMEDSPPDSTFIIDPDLLSKI